MAHDGQAPASLIDLSRAAIGHPSASQYAVKSRESGTRPPSVGPATLSPKGGLAAAQSRPQPFAVDQHAPIRNHVSKERRLGLCVLEPNDIDAPACSRSQFGAELDDAL
jgi:hypothetical protein